MPIIRLKEIIDMDSKERSKKLTELRAEQSRLRTMISAGGAVENPARIKEIRKAIARIMTIENQQKPKNKASEKETAESKQEKKEKTEKAAKKAEKTKAEEKKKE
ncbi:TPA: 50S ribosomal protein L29 [Candidatus Bathyarchaeota archaeon]|nr:50S ribosomal protein L29 [Candidatus Bathyarchaeota archaeon]HIJ09003.1 50S ribosomal protein L29 [Candidatus Bathyarchaeota archaeon]